MNTINHLLSSTVNFLRTGANAVNNKFNSIISNKKARTVAKVVGAVSLGIIAAAAFTVCATVGSPVVAWTACAVTLAATGGIALIVTKKVAALVENHLTNKNNFKSQDHRDLADILSS